MKRKVYLTINGLVMIANLLLLGLVVSLGTSPILPIMSFLAGAFGFSYWLFHDK